jgi:hypothetical protein
MENGRLGGKRSIGRSRGLVSFLDRGLRSTSRKRWRTNRLRTATDWQAIRVFRHADDRDQIAAEYAMCRGGDANSRRCCAFFRGFALWTD